MSYHALFVVQTVSNPFLCGVFVVYVDGLKSNAYPTGP